MRYTVGRYLDNKVNKRGVKDRRRANNKNNNNGGDGGGGGIGHTEKLDIFEKVKSHTIKKKKQRQEGRIQQQQLRRNGKTQRHRNVPRKASQMGTSNTCAGDEKRRCDHDKGREGSSRQR